LPCNATGRPCRRSPRLGSVGLPVHPDHVRAGGVGDLFQRPACPRRKGDHRRTGLPRDPRGLRQIGQREGPEVLRPEGRGPRVEELDRLRPGLDLGAEKGADGAGEAIEQPMASSGCSTRNRLARVKLFDPSPSIM
jgi:hypothetical protein